MLLDRLMKSANLAGDSKAFRLGKPGRHLCEWDSRGACCDEEGYPKFVPGKWIELEKSGDRNICRGLGEVGEGGGFVGEELALMPEEECARIRADLKYEACIVGEVEG